MRLVELAFPLEASESTRERAAALCVALDKDAVEVPDLAGFVVNRLLFPYLFSAVDFMERTGLEPQAVDTCMQLGAAHPMGPIALLDYIGLDVSVAIGDAIEADVPQRLRDLCAEGALGPQGRARPVSGGDVRRAGARGRPCRLGSLQRAFSEDSGGRWSIVACDIPRTPPRSTRRARAIRGPVVFLASDGTTPVRRACLRRPTGGGMYCNVPGPRNLRQLVRTTGSRYAGAASCAGSARFSRMRTASMRFSRTDSTRIW